MNSNKRDNSAQRPPGFEDNEIRVNLINENLLNLLAVFYF